MNSRKVVGGTRYKGIAKASQACVERMENWPGKDHAYSGVAEVIEVHTDRNTCDIQSWNGARQDNVPVLTKGGLLDGEVWGEIEMPTEGSFVTVDFVEGKDGFPYITGVILPYGYSKFQSNQVPVNSASKTYTQKLLEDGIIGYFRKIFQSGTTVEVQDDGTVIVELPDGSYVKFDATAGTFHLEDSNGNVIESSGTTVTINGNLEIDQ